MLDVAEDGVEALHSIDDLEGRLLARRTSLIGEQEQWKRIVLKDAIDQLLLLSDGPDKFSLILPIYDQRVVWAATGPALEAFSKYPVVKKADEPSGQMTVSEFLRQVRRLVVDFVVGRVLTHGEATEMAASLDDVTTYYLLHRHDFGLDDAPIGACILYALSCNLSDSELADRFDIFSRSGGTLFDDLEETENGDGAEHIETPDEDSDLPAI
jgi:hypothetical protein